MQPASWTARVGFVGVLLTAAVLTGTASTPASAADPAHQLATVRAEVDQLGGQYFAAKSRLQSLDTELSRLHAERVHIEHEYSGEHRLAVRRAVARYIEGDVTPTDAESALDAASTNTLLEHTAALTNAAMARYVHLHTSLVDTEQQITSQRRAQQALVNELAARTQTLDRDLAAAQRAYREMLVARAAAQAQSVAGSNTHHKTGSSSAPTTATPSVPPVTNQPVPTPPPPPPPGTNPHHNDPFLSCVRQRESSGYYGAVNPGGYYGAYQFAITTWNITASHAGMPDLIGVRPDHASPWDQDQLAWVLYQWQGMGPWGGGCG